MQKGQQKRLKSYLRRNRRRALAELRGRRSVNLSVWDNYRLVKLAAVGASQWLWWGVTLLLVEVWSWKLRMLLLLVMGRPMLGLQQGRRVA